jgi:hypothetical protein
VTEKDLNEARETALRREKSLAEWRPTLESALKGLETPIEARRKTAAEKILAIKDPAATAALEELLSTHSEDAALLAVQVIGSFDTQEATNALARQSVLSPSERVRRQAAKLLRERPLDSYVPTLLAEMYTPVRSMTQLAPAPGGRLVFRHAFLREGQGERQQVVLDTAYRRIALGGGSRRDSTRRALTDAQLTAINREVAVNQQNQWTQEVNGRICQTLNYTTDQNIAPAPENWWNWWNERNEIFVESEKPIETIYASEETEVVDRVGGDFTKDCLIAGTPVWTSVGALPVEQMKVGDLVLSQDPRTGELAYKPVLGVTVRPRGKLIRVQAGDDTFQTSGGHLFWVSGEGWVKARDLQSGHELHGATGPVRVVQVGEGDEAETFNLVVADFNTYFVGAGRVLSHDNTIRQPIDVIVPGLTQ